MTLHLAGVNYESLVDGEGVRTAIYLSGCAHRCPGCHNPETWNPEYGQPMTGELIQCIADGIASRRGFLSGITLTGGDPLYDPAGTCDFLLRLRAALSSRGCDAMNTWLYTGFTLAELLSPANPHLICNSIHRLLRMIDTLVDGPFIRGLADKTLKFRGSSNQRIWTRDEIKREMIKRGEWQ